MKPSEKRFLSYFLPIAGATILGLCIGISAQDSVSQPIEVYHVEDLNHDGPKDIVIKQRGGRKIPMYGTNTQSDSPNSPDTIRYISADEIRERITQEKEEALDKYKTIEEKLKETGRK